MGTRRRRRRQARHRDLLLCRFCCQPTPEHAGSGGRGAVPSLHRPLLQGLRLTDREADHARRLGPDPVVSDARGGRDLDGQRRLVHRDTGHVQAPATGQQLRHLRVTPADLPRVRFTPGGRLRIFHSGPENDLYFDADEYLETRLANAQHHQAECQERRKERHQKRLRALH